MTSAWLFVALLIVVDLSYRRWTRRYVARRLQRAPHASRLVDLTDTSVGPNATPTASRLTVLRRRDDASRPHRERG